MRIKFVKINNYRNLDNVSVDLHPFTNYIIGENNLGKSNFLDVLDTIFNSRKIVDEDYYDINRNIEIEVTIQLDDQEFVFFADNFNPDDASEMTIRFSQGINDNYPIIICLNTNETLQSKQLKRLHYVRYQSSVVAPTKELKLSQPSGASRVFDGLVEMYLSDETRKNDFINKSSINELSNHVNNLLSKIDVLNRYGIKATIGDNIHNLISSMYFLSDGNRKIESAGSGVQYIAMVSLNILSQIMGIYKKRGTKFEDQYYIDDDGKKILPMLIALDEPEAHLHPFLQRTLIEYYKRILNNEDENFKLLIKSCFDIDGISGQLFIVTHSSDVLVDDYRNLIRFYKKSGKTFVASGFSFGKEFNSSNEKQLIMRFHDLRESFYSHCVIIVEGETEYGCMPYFADKLGIPLDDNCISVIMANGEGSIKPLRKMFDCFHIPTVCIYDGDVREKRSTNSPYEFFTDSKCLETDIIDKLYECNQIDVIKEIARDMDRQADKVLLDYGYVKDQFKYLGLSTDGYSPKKLSDIDEQNKDEFCNLYKVWFMKHKGVLSGRTIGMHTPVECIPNCYSMAFKRAIERACE